MSTNNPNFLADGAILPSRFVKNIDASGDNRVLQATANDTIVGISQEWTKDAPLPSNTNAYAAESGDPITVYGPGDQCLLEYGATVIRGQKLKSDSVGRGVTVTGTTAQNVGAIALESGTTGEFHRVAVRCETTSAPAS